mmetsp:Transcript_26458/g.66573  ORF Transcript_26458/g.66573 Transcript_26458/m.66573 type:complete len:203 (+) Transcript_26458:115-723(+)
MICSLPASTHARINLFSMSSFTCPVTLRNADSRPRERSSWRFLIQSRRTCGVTFFSSSWMLSGCLAMKTSSCRAAPTAPHASCPSTSTSLTLRAAMAYSMEAMVKAVATLPATRTTNSFPKDWSNTISTGTRESEQPRMAAKGSCARMCARLSRIWLSSRLGLLLTKRALPSSNSRRASSGLVMVAGASACNSSSVRPIFRF